jgi:hypothetical protein
VTQDWGNFAVITGSAAGALTGLLFVAVSLSRERITAHVALRSEAGQTLVLFMLPLLLSALLVLPGTSATALGIGLITLAIVAAATLVRIARAKRGNQPTGDGLEDRLARLLDRASPNLIVLVFTLAGGCLELAGIDGLYLAAASSVLALIGGVVNAWLFLTRS